MTASFLTIEDLNMFRNLFSWNFPRVQNVFGKFLPLSRKCPAALQTIIVSASLTSGKFTLRRLETFRDSHARSTLLAAHARGHRAIVQEEVMQGLIVDF